MKKCTKTPVEKEGGYTGKLIKQMMTAYENR